MMEFQAPKLTTYSAQELEAFAKRPSDRPEWMSSRDLDALLIGHPMTKLPVDCYKTPNDIKSHPRMEAIEKLLGMHNNFWIRIISTFTFLMATTCFIFVVTSEFYRGMIHTLYVGGKQLKTHCQYFFSFKPQSCICYGVLGLTCMALLLLAALTKISATRVTDYIVQRTITLAAQHILRKVHYMYGILRSPDKSNLKVNKPISYHACKYFDIILRSRLFMTISNGAVTIVCVICLFFDIHQGLTLQRWLIFLALVGFLVYSCILSKNLMAVQWFKVVNLLFLALSLCLISKLTLPSYYMTMLWQFPANFFQTVREMEVFKGTVTRAPLNSDGKTSFENRSNWLFVHVHRMSYLFLLSLLIRIFNIHKQLNLLQVIFRYNYLLEPVESVALVVAFCHLPPVASILLLRSQLKYFTQSEIDSLIIVGATQSLFTSCSPAIRSGNDYITDSRFLCLVVPTATVCAITVGSIISPPVIGEKSKLLRHSQRMRSQSRISWLGFRKLMRKNTHVTCRVLLLLILAHQLQSRFVFVIKQALRLVVSHSTQVATNWKTSSLRYLLIWTGMFLTSPKQLYSLIFSGTLSNEKLASIDVLTQETYPVLLTTPKIFESQADSCQFWAGISKQIADEMANNTLPLLTSTHEHSIFLLLLRMAQNNIEELLFYMAVLVVNVNVKSQVNIVATMFRLIPAFFIAVAILFIVVNFVSSIAFF